MSPSTIYFSKIREVSNKHFNISQESFQVHEISKIKGEIVDRGIMLVSLSFMSKGVNNLKKNESISNKRKGKRLHHKIRSALEHLYSKREMHHGGGGSIQRRNNIQRRRIQRINKKYTLFFSYGDDFVWLWCCRQ